MARQLTAKQAKFVEAIKDGLTPTAACRRAGYSAAGQSAYLLMRNPLILERIHAARAARINGDLGKVALDTMQDLMSPDSPANVRYSAAKWVLEAGGHGGQPAQGDDMGTKRLEDMNAQELQAAVSAGMGALQELAQQLDGHHIIDGTARPVRDIQPADDLDFLT